MRPVQRPFEPYRWTYDFLVPLILYLDDIRDVFNVLAQVGPIDAQTDTHEEIRSFEEFKTLENRPIRELHINVLGHDNETVTADFGARGASVTITSPRPEFVGAVTHIQQIGWRHWRRTSLADNGMVFLLFNLVLAGAIGAASLDAIRPWNIVLAIAVAAIGALLFLLGRREARTAWTRFPMVWYANRPPSFFDRNRDQLIITGVSLIAGFLLGLAADGLYRPS